MTGWGIMWAYVISVRQHCKEGIDPTATNRHLLDLVTPMQRKTI